MKYWEERAARDMWEYMRSAEDKANEIGLLYSRSAQYLTKAADGIFEKYQKEYGLSKADAKRLINKLKSGNIREAVDKLQTMEDSPEKTELIKLLDGAAYRTRIARLEALQRQLDVLMEQVYQVENIETHDFYVELAADVFDHSMYRIQQQAGYGFNFNPVSQKQIDRVLKIKWDGANYSKRIWSNTQMLAEDVRRQLTSALLTGQTERATAAEIMHKYHQGASKARRLIRTESNYLATGMQQMAYEEAGIEQYRFTAVLDLKTSDICRKMDGKVFKVKDRKPGINCPPMHPWCRSTTTAVFSPEIEERMKRSALDPKTDKHILVPRNMTYKEWHKKFVEGNPEVEAKEKALKHIRMDRKQFEAYQKILGDKAPKTLEDFQKLKYQNPKHFAELRKQYAEKMRAQRKEKKE